MTGTPTSRDSEQARERERAAAGLWAELTRVHGAVRGSLETYLGGETGLVPEDADLLMVLAQAPEQRMRMVDVSAALRLSKSGVTRLVDRLAEQDWLADMLGAVAAEATWLVSGDDARFMNEVARRTSERD